MAKQIIIIIIVDFVVLAMYLIFQQPALDEHEFTTESLVLPVLFVINLVAGLLLVMTRKRK